MASEKIDALELDINAKLTTENLDKLITALGRLSKALDNVNAKKVKDDIKDTGDASKEAAAKADLLTNSFVNQAVKITALVAVYRKLADVISTGIENSMSYVENMNLFTVSLGQYSENASKYADTVRDALGIDPSGWIRTQGVFNTLIEGFGVGAEQAAYMSQNLTQLTYDIASFANISIADAEKKVQSAVAGELEPVRRLGYDLSQNALTAIAQNPEYYGETTYSVNELTGALEANSTALEDNTVRTIANFNELTQAEKVQLRYIALMTQIPELQGDMARTLNDPANQMRIFKEQLTMTSRALGNVFIPALNEVMPYLIAFFRVVEEGLQRLAALAGFELPDMSDRMNVSEDVPYYENIVESTGKAAKNAKKMKDYMIGIDELNVLRPDDGTTSGGSGSDNPYALGSIYKTPGYDFLSSAIENRIKDIKEAFDELGKDFEEHPLQVTGKILWEGFGTIGEGFWTWFFGQTPDEIAEEASRNGGSIGKALWTALVNESPVGEAGETVWEWLLGESNDELAQEAWDSGHTVGEQFYISLFRSMGSGIVHSGGGAVLGQSLFGENSALGQRAAEAGRTVGEQFTIEAAKKILEVFSSNPGLQKIYEIATGGRSAVSDLEEITRKLTKKPITQGLTGEEFNDEFHSWLSNKQDFWVGSNTSAQEAKKRGEDMIKGFAQGMNSGMSSVRLGASNLYKTALNGINNNGTASTNFANLGSNMTRAFTSALASQGSLNNAYNAGYKVSQFGYEGANANTVAYSNIADSLANLFSSALGSSANRSKAYSAGSYLSNEGSWGTTEYNDDYYYTGDMAGQGFVLGIRKHEYNAKVEGQRIAQAALYNLAEALGIASPSKEAYKMGKFFDEGFSNAIGDFSYTAEDAANEMAKLSLQAIRTSNAMFNSGVSVPTNNNSGYGVGAMNESAMMNMASTIYQAVVSGISTINLNGDDRDIKVIIDGKEVFTAVETERRRRGVGVGSNAFGGV